MPPDPLFPHMLTMAPAGDQPTLEPGLSPVELFQATIESGLKFSHPRSRSGQQQRAQVAYQSAKGICGSPWGSS